MVGRPDQRNRSQYHVRKSQNLALPSHLLLNTVLVREGAKDRGSEEGSHGFDGAQYADLVLCSAESDDTTSARKKHHDGSLILMYE